MVHVPEGTDIRQAVSLDAPGLDDGDPLVASVPDPGDGPEEATAGRELVRAIATLDPRSASILRRRFAGERLEDVGADLGLTRERVREIEADAVRVLRWRVA